VKLNNPRLPFRNRRILFVFLISLATFAAPVTFLVSASMRSAASSGEHAAGGADAPGAKAKNVGAASSKKAGARDASLGVPDMSLAPLSAPLISATKTDALVADTNGDGTAGSGDTLRYTVQISNSGAAAALGLMFADTIDPNTTLVNGSLKTTPLARNDSYNASGNIQISIPAPGLLSNDLDPDGNTPGLVVSSINTAGTQGNVTANPDGSFTFNPSPGFEGSTSFTYTITDTDGNTDTAQVSVGVSGMIWFVNAAASCPCDGRLTSPFNALAGAGSFDALAADAPGDNIFVYSGNYTGGLTLLNNQKLIGQGAGASLSSITGIVPPSGSPALPSTGGARPVVSSSANNLTLGSGNLVRGLNLNTNGATALSGNNFGALLIDEMSVANSNGVAINLNTGTPDATFTSVSASGGAQGITVSNTDGSFTVEGTGTTDGSGGTIQNVTGRGASWRQPGVEMRREPAQC
jgi:uncharacterized repeat protein (TIGR01451 family)